LYFLHLFRQIEVAKYKIKAFEPRNL